MNKGTLDNAAFIFKMSQIELLIKSDCWVGNLGNSKRRGLSMSTEQRAERERERRARWPELRLQSTELPNKEEKALKNRTTKLCSGMHIQNVGQSLNIHIAFDQIPCFWSMVDWIGRRVSNFELAEASPKPSQAIWLKGSTCCSSWKAFSR